MNQVFLAIVAIAFVVGAVTGEMNAVSQGAFDGAKSAVTLAIGLIGYMALFLGLMKVAEEGGLLRLLARAIRPIMVRLFPDVPPEHPAMGAMIMNIAANMLGLTNAATPLGIKAMQELNSLNRTPGVATNAMVLFLAINTSGLALLPSGAVSVRAAEGSTDPWGIVASTLVATAVATICGVSAAKLLQRLPMFRAPAPEAVAELALPETPSVPDADASDEPEAEAPDERQAEADRLIAEEAETPVTWGVWSLRGFLVAVMFLLAGPALSAALIDFAVNRAPEGSMAALATWVEPLRSFAGTTGDWVIPTLILSLLLYGQAKGVKVYETFVQGAKEGFNTGVMIIPYLVAILAAVGMFRGSGAMHILTSKLGLISQPLGVPGEVLPMALVRPLSGSGAYGLMIELVQTHGPDSYIGYLATTLQGSTDTTFYVLAVYFGAVGVSRTRHAVLAGLTADLAGFLGAALICGLLFGHLLL